MMHDHAPTVLSADTLKDDDVRNSQGEDLGKIKDFMIDVEDGRIVYAVLDFGGFLGMGGKLFAVPFQAMTLNRVDKCYILDADKERLKNAPGFEKDNWPEHADYSFINDAYAYYGLEPYHPLTHA